jgi:hypothetical protein
VARGGIGGSPSEPFSFSLPFPFPLFFPFRRVVGNASHPFDRKPTPVYSSFSDEFFIAYESGPYVSLFSLFLLSFLFFFFLCATTR